MSTSHLVFRAALVASLLAPINACSDGTGSGDTAPVTLMLTDAPGDFKAAVVTISEIYLQGDGRTVLMDQPATINLLDLANEAVTLVADAEVPAGRYAQLRFVITGGYVEVETDGGGSAFYASSPDYAGLPAGVSPGELQMPSFDASGLKVVFAGGAVEVAGAGKVLLLDFDVHQSFGHEAGSDRWVLSPVIRGAELGTTGSIAVNVSGVAPESEAPDAVLRDEFGGETPVALTDEDGDGEYSATFLYLLPGSYGVYLSGAGGAAVTTDPAADAAAPLGVTLDAGESETVTLEIVPAG